MMSPWIRRISIASPAQMSSRAKARHNRDGHPGESTEAAEHSRRGGTAPRLVFPDEPQAMVSGRVDLGLLDDSLDDLARQVIFVLVDLDASGLPGRPVA